MGCGCTTPEAVSRVQCVRCVCRVRAGRGCVTSPVRVVWVWVWAAVCAVSCVRSRCARHVKGRAQCKLLLSLRGLRHIDCAYGVYSLAGLTGYSAYTLLPSLAPYLARSLSSLALLLFRVETERCVGAQHAHAPRLAARRRCRAPAERVAAGCTTRRRSRGVRAGQAA